MCGIAGFIDARTQQADELSRLGEKMAQQLAHRGPDGHGVWVERDSGVAFAHRRLSIIDLSPHGAQPMHSAGGRYVVTFNGEIYNHKELRRELEDNSAAPAWRGHSDTEVMLAAFEHWGVRGTLPRLNGMFAIAVWDRKNQVLCLARDRLGEKPLYYGVQRGAFLFGSELKALRAHPAWVGEVDRDALTLMLRYATVPAPHCIYRGIKKLPPACLAILAPRRSLEVELESYWSLDETVSRGRADPYRGTGDEAAEELERLLLDAVKLRMEADVPLGAFLSGGVDSSTVVALMQAQSSQPVRTFSIGFQEAAYDEAPHAKAVAAHLGTRHTELYATPEQAMGVIPRLAGIYDEPFADSSQIPTILVSELARHDVTVSLSGDAGDELFAGYNRYVVGARLWKSLHWLPSQLRRAGSGLVRSLSRVMLDTPAAGPSRLVPAAGRIPLLGEKVRKIQHLLEARNSRELYRGLLSNWQQPGLVVRNGGESATVLADIDLWKKAGDLVSSMMAMDTLLYLPDDILTKVDRATMSVSLEGRIPLLDHRVVEFAWRLPLAMKLAEGTGKRVLRRVLYKHVPPSLIERPKMGFGVPIDEWLKGPLRPWAEALLDETRLRNEGFFNPAPIREKWQEHVGGRDNWHHALWCVLMFQAWLERNR